VSSLENSISGFDLLTPLFLDHKPKNTKPELSRVKSAVDVSPKLKPVHHHEPEKKGSAIFASLGESFDT